MQMRPFEFVALRRLALMGLCLGLCSLVLLQAGAAANNRAIDDGEDDKVSLHDHMEAINDSLRQVMRSLDPDKQADALTNIAILQKHLVAAKSIDPPGLASQPEADQATYKLGYRRALAEVLVEVARLELDVIDGNGEEAKARIRETIIGMRNAAHETYQVDD